jgi:hypothetical protein
MMKNVKECIEKIKAHRNVLELVQHQVYPEALGDAHYPETLKGIWWYHLGSKQFSWSNKAKSHMDLDNFPEVQTLQGWVRGRVFSNEGKNYILMYADDFSHGRIPGSVVHDIYQKITSKFHEPITDFVDERGYSLLGE